MHANLTFDGIKEYSISITLLPLITHTVSVDTTGHSVDYETWNHQVLWDQRLSWSNCQWRCISSSGRGCPRCRSVHIIGVQPARRLLERHPKHLGFHYIGLTLQIGDSTALPTCQFSKSLNGIRTNLAKLGP